MGFLFNLPHGSGQSDRERCDRSDLLCNPSRPVGMSPTSEIHKPRCCQKECHRRRWPACWSCVSDRGMCTSMEPLTRVSVPAALAWQPGKARLVSARISALGVAWLPLPQKHAGLGDMWLTTYMMLTWFE